MNKVEIIASLIKMKNDNRKEYLPIYDLYFGDVDRLFEKEIDRAISLIKNQ